VPELDDQLSWTGLNNFESDGSEGEEEQEE